MPDVQIRAEDLSKAFGQFLAVDGVNLMVAAGEVLVLLGPNGAGKTTTVRMLTSVLKPTRGRAWIAGFDVVSQPDKVRAAVGVLTEQHGLYNRMLAQDYLDFYGGLYGMKRTEIRRRAATLMATFGLSGSEDKRLGEYSKGMRQKLALVRALLHDPPVLLLDEPTSAMDPESALTVRDSIHHLRSSHRAIIICTHNLAEAEQLADQVAIIRQGKIIVSGPVDALKLDLLGPTMFEACLASPVQDFNRFPPGVSLVGKGADWLRFSVERPEENNPLLLHNLLEAGLQVVTFQPVPRQLEQVYMAAIQKDPHGS